jgi:hypothetical protein
MLVEEIKKRKNDPLSILYQLDEDRSIIPNIELTALTNMFDDVEKMGVLKDTINDMIITDEVAGIRFLNQLEIVIQGIKREQMKRANKEWRHKFLSALEFLYSFTNSAHAYISRARETYYILFKGLKKEGMVV